MGACVSSANKTVKSTNTEHQYLPVTGGLGSDGYCNTKQIERWTVDDIYEWLSTAENGDLLEVAKIFRSSQIRGKVLDMLTEKELTQMGISIGNQLLFRKAKNELYAQLKGRSTAPPNIAIETTQNPHPHPSPPTTTALRPQPGTGTSASSSTGNHIVMRGFPMSPNGQLAVSKGYEEENPYQAVDFTDLTTNSDGKAEAGIDADADTEAPETNKSKVKSKSKSKVKHNTKLSSSLSEQKLVHESAAILKKHMSLELKKSSDVLRILQDNLETDDEHSSNLLALLVQHKWLIEHVADANGNGNGNENACAMYSFNHSRRRQQQHNSASHAHKKRPRRDKNGYVGTQLQVKLHGQWSRAVVLACLNDETGLYRVCCYPPMGDEQVHDVTLPDVNASAPRPPHRLMPHHSSPVLPANPYHSETARHALPMLRSLRHCHSLPTAPAAQAVPRARGQGHSAGQPLNVLHRCPPQRPFSMTQTPEMTVDGWNRTFVDPYKKK